MIEAACEKIINKAAYRQGGLKIWKLQ
jgi:hypothetical protein